VTFDAGSRSRSLSLSVSLGGRGRSRTESQRSLGKELKTRTQPISRPSIDATGSLQPAGGRTAHKHTALCSASSEQRKTPEQSSQIHSQSALCARWLRDSAREHR